jgi:membrane-associated protease RseP (regulator of RpoE activity)
LLRALPLAAAAGMVAVAACTVVSGTGRGTAGPVAQVTREITGGREVIIRDNGDGTETMMVGPAPGVDSLGTAGFSWVYRFNPPLQVTPGSLPSPRSMYAVVTNVEAGSPAAAAGLRPDDVILSANGVTVMATPLLTDRRPGTAYDFRVRRGGAEMDVHLVLGPPTKPRGR